MKSVYISQFVLEVPTQKNELCAKQLIKLKEAFIDKQVDFVKVLMILIDVRKHFRFYFWYQFHCRFLAWFYHSIVGALVVWVAHHFFKKDILVTELHSEMIEAQVLEVCEFMNNSNEICRIKPVSKLGIFQHLTSIGFDETTTEQFIEAYRCLITMEASQSETAKLNCIDEMLAYLFAPKWMWYFGVNGRLFFLKQSFYEARKKKVQRLPESIKILLYQYYLDNLSLMKLLYKHFYEEPEKEESTKKDVFTQYFSMKSLIQLRSENGTLSPKIRMMPIRDLIESYEVEIIQSKIKKEKYDSSRV